VRDWLGRHLRAVLVVVALIVVAGGAVAWAAWPSSTSGSGACGSPNLLGKTGPNVIICKQRSTTVTTTP
jgi:hypothetical protein